MRRPPPTPPDEATCREPSLRELLEAVADSRDRDAFARLFSHYAPRIKGMMLKRGADEATAEELAQEAMLRVWHRAPDYRPERGGAGAWIFTIARNLYIDRVRKERRFDHDAGTEIADPHPGTESRYAIRQDQHALQAAVASLPPEQAEVVRISYWRGLSLRAVAEETNLPLGTVKTRARLALARLRDALAGAREDA